MTPDIAAKLLEEACAKASKHDVEKKYVRALFMQSSASAQKDNLIKLRGLASAQMLYEELIGELEVLAKTVTASYAELAETILPSLLDELDIKGLQLSETQKLEIKEKITANIPAAKLDEGCAWLEKNGHGAIIKQQITTEFGTNEGEKADKVVEAIKALELGIEPSVKRSVNHMTLGALVRGLLTEGEEVPFETLGVFRRRASVVSTKK